MAQILSQEEIDALLEASQKGELKEDGSVPQLAKPDVSDYDFHRPSLITKDQLRAFTDLHDSFCRELQSSLSLLMRSGVEIKFVSTEQQQYGEFVKTLPSITYMAVMSASPLPGLVTVEMNLALIFGLVDMRLGGSGGVETEIRQPTDVEVAIVEPIVEKICDHLKACMIVLVPGLATKIERLEFNPAYLQAAPSDAPMVILSFEVKIGEAINGIINISYPVPAIIAVLERIAQKSSAIGSYYGNKDAQESRRKLMELLMDIPVKASVGLGSSLLKGRELMGMGPGDVVVLDSRAGDLLTFYVAGRPVFRGIPGQSEGKLCLKVLDVA